MLPEVPDVPGHDRQFVDDRCRCNKRIRNMMPFCSCDAPPDIADGPIDGKDVIGEFHLGLM